ncbi:MAG: SIR2 family protein, partial [Nitrospirae bacterium]|nr:SIR2 family protein [Nitrospirota bacterium]
MDHRPPLAAQLFSDRSSFVAVMAKYSQCLPIIPRLQRVAPGGSVEGELQRLQAEATEYPVRHQQLSAVRYYLQEMLWDCTRVWINSVHRITNFMTLVDDISRWKKPGEMVCFVTFNYDTMLEEALSHHMDVQFTQISSYISNNDFVLIKLHGSINWAREVRTYRPDIGRLDRRSIAQELIRPTADIRITKYYTLIGEYPPAARNNFPLFPALAIPVETKL